MIGYSICLNKREWVCAASEVSVKKKWSMYQALADLGYANYEEYLAGEHWSYFKKRYRSSSYPQTCAVCGTHKSQLHHKTYRRLGCEMLQDVVPLCYAHHAAVHNWLKEHKQTVGCTAAAIKSLKSQHEGTKRDRWGVKLRFKDQKAECQSLASRIINCKDRPWAIIHSWMFKDLKPLVKKKDLVELRRRWSVVVRLEDEIRVADGKKPLVRII